MTGKNDTIAKLKEDGILMKRGENDFKITDDIDVIGVYFSAHWCPPCQAFTPVLVKFYNHWKQQGKKFEIIFVSSDEGPADFVAYFKEMPWAALKFDKRKVKEEVMAINGVRRLPTLRIFNKHGQLIEEHGREKVMESCYKKTYKKMDLVGMTVKCL